MLSQQYQEMINYKLINNLTSWCIALMLFVLCTPSAFASWSFQSSGTSEDLSAVDFPVDGSTGYAAGNRGVLLKTSDGGHSWQQLKSQTRNSMLDIDFIDNQTGFAVGANGTLLKTTDGGKRWTALNVGTSEHLYAVDFPVDSNTGYIGGSNRTLLKTTDGGQTWTPQYIADGYVQDIVFPSNNSVGYAVTLYGSLAYVYKTVDGGQNWTQVFYLEDAFIYSMSFPDEQTGYIANHDTYYQHGIWKTSDGGANWSLVTQGATTVPYAVNFPFNALNGFAVGYNGTIMTTQDGGANWTEGNLGVNTTLKDIQFIDNNTAYIVGRAGLIAKTTDGGAPNYFSAYLHPTSSGSVQNFTDISGCSTDWDCVNDQPGNVGIGLPVTAQSLSYVADGSGNRHMFGLDDNALGNVQISEICVAIAATQWIGVYGTLSYQRIGIDPAIVDSNTFYIGNYWYNGPSLHCWNNLNWNANDLNALEIGVKTVAGQRMELGQIFVKVFYQPLP